VIITVCGSKRYKDEIDRFKQDLTLMGIFVLTPVFIDRELTDTELSVLSMMHYNKIKMADEVVILHCNNKIGNHTKAEYIMAKAEDKKIKMVNVKTYEQEDGLDITSRWLFSSAQTHTTQT
jgi:hypothetical protein